MHAMTRPSLQNTPKPNKQYFNFGEIWCFCDLVAIFDFSEWAQYLIFSLSVQIVLTTVRA
jgi:hypothetical protein